MAFTYFLRDLPTLELAVKHLLPYTSGRSTVRVWDAGCAMGQEPYSLAIVFAESMGYFGFKTVQILATDLDNSDLFGPIIREGVYPAEELQRVPEALLKKYFRPATQPNSYQVVETLRSRISFRKHDLLSFQPAGREFHLIVCKNVLLHFNAEERTKVLRMFHGALAPGGILATEQTQKMPPELAPLFEQAAMEAQVFRKNGGPA